VKNQETGKLRMEEHTFTLFGTFIHYSFQRFDWRDSTRTIGDFFHFQMRDLSRYGDCFPCENKLIKQIDGH
jgi:hypothetical protein